MTTEYCGENSTLEALSKAERECVCRHRQRLSTKTGHEVSIEEALSDWLENYAEAWRAQRQAHMLAMQRKEILRHKWIESEKAQRDLGSAAVLDWIEKHAARWRDWYETECEFSEAS